MLSRFKFFLTQQKTDFFLLPNSDEFFSEYLPEHEKKIQHLTGFTGSSATVIFGQEKSYFFTDGRYLLQAKNELNSLRDMSRAPRCGEPHAKSSFNSDSVEFGVDEFKILNIAEKSVLTWLAENLSEGKSLALDPKLSSVNFTKTCLEIAEKNSAGLIFTENDWVEKFWQNRPAAKNSEIYFCSEKLTGASSREKRQQVLKNLSADALLITKPENLCWMLNARAADVEFTPLLLAYGILFKNGEVELFADEKRCAGAFGEEIKFIQPNYFESRIEALAKTSEKIQIDSSSTNYWLYQLLKKNSFEISDKKDPIEILKSRKNKTEISGAIKAHEADGLALTKFLFWLENAEEIDEIKAEERLLEFRKEDPNFLCPSFASISSYASNGAIIHYRASTKTNKKISGNSLYLIDSGGQYFGGDFFGTTDVTRTIAIGKPSAEMVENFTRVLKGHIALARAKFPVGTSGAQLDVLARSHLWQANKDYDHGTGHGVGSFLSVHEGPCGISRRVHQELLPGMILSNEPGFYREGEYGIRIESLMLVEQCDEKFLQFKTLTLAPVDSNLIDFKMLTRPEKTWLRDYHARIFETLEGKLDQESRGWLKKICEFCTRKSPDL